MLLGNKIEEIARRPRMGKPSGNRCGKSASFGQFVREVPSTGYSKEYKKQLADDPLRAIDTAVKKTEDCDDQCVLVSFTETLVKLFKLSINNAWKLTQSHVESDHQLSNTNVWHLEKTKGRTFKCAATLPCLRETTGAPPKQVSPG